MSSAQFLQISSKYRTDQNDDPGSCYITMPMKLREGRYKLAYALMPNTFYTVDATNNLVYLDGVVLEVPTGFYNTDTFPIAFKAVLDSAGGQTYTVTLSNLTNKLTISAVADFTLDFTQDHTCYALVGFKRELVTSVGGSVQCPNMINLSPIHTINVSIDSVASISQRNLQGTTFIIPVPAGSLSYINYISTSGFEQVMELHENKRVIRCVLRNDLNEPLVLNGVDFMLVLEQLS